MNDQSILATNEPKTRNPYNIDCYLMKIMTPEQNQRF